MDMNFPAYPNSSSATLDTTAVRDQIDGWTDLRPEYRLALRTAINHVERTFADDRASLAGAPLWSCVGLNRLLYDRPYQIYGISDDAFRNLVSGLRTVLIRLGLHADSRYGQNTLNPAWQVLYEQVPTTERKRSLIRFFRFLTLEGVSPEAVTPDSIDQFGRWCAVRILCDDPAGMSRRAASNWEFVRRTVPGWPQVEFHRADMRDHYSLPLSAFPQTFQNEVNAFLGGLANGRGPIFPSGNPYLGLTATAGRTVSDNFGSRGAPRALAKRTVDGRGWQILAAATALVLAGTLRIEQVTSLTTLVRPIGHLVSILSFHRDRLARRLSNRGQKYDDDDLKSSTLRNIGEVLRQIAKFEVRMLAEELSSVTAYVAAVTPPEQVTMTAANRSKLRFLLADPARTRLLHLSGQWMREAGDPAIDQRAAALLAMHAVALEILLVFPLRRGNLLQLQLDQHVKRSRPNALPDRIVVPARMVKNREPLSWPLDAVSGKIIDAYISKYRPLLAADQNTFLFPGLGLKHRNEAEFGNQFSKRVTQRVGAAFNCHLVRHFAVVRYLQASPGAYEVAAQILGHKNPETTRRFYCGLEQDAAARHANAVLTEDRHKTKHIAVGAFARPKRRFSKGGV